MGGALRTSYFMGGALNMVYNSKVQDADAR